MKKKYLSLSRKAVTGVLLSLFAMNMTLVSCSSSEDSPINNPSTGNKGSYFIAVKTDNGTEYIMQTNSLTAGDLDIKNNIMELPQTEYTWVFNNHDAIGMVYQQQFAGLGYGLRWTSDDAQLSKLGEFRIDTRFSNYGFFNGQLVTSVGGQVSADGSRNDGATFAFWNITDEGVKLDAAKTKTLWTEDITGNGQQVTFSSIVDNGDGTFLTAMVQSAFHQTGIGDGSSVGEVKYPDSVWVAKMDKDLNILHIYRDNRIGTSVGAQRSVRYTQSGADDNGNMDASGKMAVVDMDAQTLTWVTGLPDASTVSFGWGDGYAGAYYLPVAAPTSMSGGSGSGSGGWNHGGSSANGSRATSTSSIVPTIYKIDANTGVATAFMTFGNGDLLKAITILKQ